MPKCFTTLAAANPYKFKSMEELEERNDSLKISGCSN